MHVVVVDGNALVWTMFHATKEESWAGDKSTSAIKATVNWFRSALQRNRDAVYVILWDGRAQWRYDLYPAYKSNRNDTPLKREQRTSFAWQLPWVKNILGNFPLVQIEHPAAEADDVGWGLSQALLRAGHYVEVRTDDSDWQQMIAARLAWQSLRKGARRVEMSDFVGLSPYQAICEVKAIAGDSSDTLEGVDQIADIRASALLQRYGDLSKLLLAASDPFAFKEEPKWARSLALPDNQNLILRNLKLVTLKRAPGLKASDCLTSGNEFDEIELMAALEQLEFNEWFNDFEWNFRRFAKPMNASGLQTVTRALHAWDFAWDSEPLE